MTRLGSEASTDRLGSKLAQDLPALAPVIEHAARANMRGDAEQAARWRAEIAPVSNEHRSQVDDFFRRYPKTQNLIATAEGQRK